MHQFVLINTRTIRAVLQFCAYNTRRAGAREGGRGRARGARAEPLLHASHSGIIQSSATTMHGGVKNEVFSKAVAIQLLIVP